MVADIASGMTVSIYHERQIKELCALHALNNLFQERGFSKQELDQICYNLSPDVWINPHKSLLGCGNYDINVIMTALQRRGCEAVWFDKRRDTNCLYLNNIEGFILNVPTEYKLGFVLLPLKRRHWIALKRIDGAFYNLDSKLDTPQLIGTDSDILAYLKEQMESKEKELFLVVTQEVENNQGWLIESTEKNSNEKTETLNEFINDNQVQNANIDLNLNNSNDTMNENGNFCNNQSSR
ncbi:PREDICTED: josephin-2 [Ceratosolen solmsi marchali]|uniref:Josephin-2 n=1 Tax=Ceratosolen solmsi marchali TaxID=326594 RepID=A0AAJ6YSJ4_9HYME|nr:PREDICTED: josephin-2 [Ceratosolen solmsi marchali]